MTERESVEHLTLMLAYLTSWREGPANVRRFWKGYDFAVLDRLVEAGLISSSHTSKSAYLTEDGEARAVKLLREYRIPIGE